MSELLCVKGKAALHEAVLRGCTVHELILIGERVLERPIVLSTANCFVWYSSKNMPGDSQTSVTGGAVVKSGPFTSDILNRMLTADEKNRIYRSGGYCYAFSKIQCRSRVIGYSYMVSDQEFSPFKLELHRCFCSILGDLMVKHDAEERFLLLSEEEALMIKTLDDRYRDFSRLDPKTIFTGRDGLMELVAVSQREDEGLIALDLVTVNELRAALKCEICFSYGSGVVGLAEFGTLKSCREALCRVLDSYDLIAGVSFPVDRMSGIETAYRQATEAASFCGPYKRLLSYAEISLKAVLSAINDRDGLCTLCNSDITFLRRIDTENGTSLTRTLYAYFTSGKSIKKTVEALNIHRNSVLARLDKIRALTSGEAVFAADGYYTLELVKNLYDLDW